MLKQREPLFLLVTEKLIITFRYPFPPHFYSLAEYLHQSLTESMHTLNDMSHEPSSDLGNTSNTRLDTNNGVTEYTSMDTNGHYIDDFYNQITGTNAQNNDLDVSKYQNFNNNNNNNNPKYVHHSRLSQQRYTPLMNGNNGQDMAYSPASSNYDSNYQTVPTSSIPPTPSPDGQQWSSNEQLSPHSNHSGSGGSVHGPPPAHLNGYQQQQNGYQTNHLLASPFNSHSQQNGHGHVNGHHGHHQLNHHHQSHHNQYNHSPLASVNHHLASPIPASLAHLSAHHHHHQFSHHNLLTTASGIDGKPVIQAAVLAGKFN